VFTSKHERIAEVFVVDLPEDLTQAGEGPLQGTETRRPLPPRGTMQRRLTFTAERKFPGLQGPRHWLRSSPDGNRIAFLMKDDLGIVQLWTVSPCGGPVAQLTRNSNSVGSTFTWSPDGHWIAHLAGTSVCISDADTGQTRRLTAPCELTVAPRGEACVFSPDGKRIAYVRPVLMDDKYYNQIFVVDIK
jgi:Tol biopolymer transport system component